MGTLSLVRPHVGGRTLQISRWIQAAYVLTDAFCVIATGVALYFVRFGLDWLPIPTAATHNDSLLVPQFPLPNEHRGFLLLYAFLITSFCESKNLYQTTRDRSAVEETLAIFQAVLLATVVLTAFIYLTKETISRLVIGLSGVFNVVTLTGWRIRKRKAVERRVANGEGVRNVLIIGTNKIAHGLAHYLDINKHLGYVVKGFIDRDHSGEPRMLGTIQNLYRVVKAHFIDEIVITTPSEKELVKAVVIEARRSRLGVKVVPELYDGLGWHAPFEYLGELPLMSLQVQPIPVLGLFLKRAIDTVFSMAALIMVSPLLAVVAILIKLDSPGPVFYRAVRVGKKGQKFTCYKFRTMVANADQLKEQLRHLNERQGPFFKIANDPRLTRFGRFLRKYSLDELPQLWNVIKGDMSLVGPRPHPTDDYARYTVEHLGRLTVTPGITGLWQVSARRDPSFAKNLALDLDYIEKWNLWLDTKILFKTISVVFSGAGE